MSATVTAPDGTRWTVQRRWLRRRPRWSRRKRDLWDLGDLGGIGDDPISAVIGIVVAVVIGVVLLVVLLPVLVLLLDLLLFLLLAAGLTLVTTLLGRPWRVEVVGPPGSSTAAVRGWRASGRAIEALRESIARTGRPELPRDGEARWV